MNNNKALYLGDQNLGERLIAVLTIAISPFMLVKAAFANDIDVVKKPFKESMGNVLFLKTVREMFSDVTDWLVG